MVVWVAAREVRTSTEVVMDDLVAEGWVQLVWARRTQTRDKRQAGSKGRSIRGAVRRRTTNKADPTWRAAPSSPPIHESLLSR